MDARRHPCSDQCAMHMRWLGAAPVYFGTTHSLRRRIAHITCLLTTESLDVTPTFRWRVLADQPACLFRLKTRSWFGLGEYLARVATYRIVPYIICTAACVRPSETTDYETKPDREWINDVDTAGNWRLTKAQQCNSTCQSATRNTTSDEWRQAGWAAAEPGRAGGRFPDKAEEMRTSEELKISVSAADAAAARTRTLPISQTLLTT